jgi:hypothetical protein
MHVFKGEHSQGVKGVASRKLWHALHAVDKYLRGQTAWLVNYAKRHHAGLRVGTSITVALYLNGSSSICVHVSVWLSDGAFPLIIHDEHDAMDARTRHSGPGS